MNNLKVTILQAALVWEDKEANLEHFSHLINKVGKTDIILLPETFNTGFSMNVNSLAEGMNGWTVSWMKEKSVETGAVIAGSLIVRDDSSWFNRLLWVQPDGNVLKYDKRHLFFGGDEHRNMAQGTEKLVVEWQGWRICPMICYDLRFPVWIRNREDYDLLIFLANWPSARHHVWKNLLAARAIENQAYCLGVNRIGSDGMGLRYLGDSGFVDPKGFPSYLGDSQRVETFTLSMEDLREFRKKFPFLKDMDKFELEA